MTLGWERGTYRRWFCFVPTVRMYALRFQPIFVLGIALVSGCSGPVVRERPSTIWLSRSDFVDRVNSRDLERYVCEYPFHLRVARISGTIFHLTCERELR